MVKFENHCCDCAVPGYPCMGARCPLRSVPVYYCDECGKEVDDVHFLGGQHYCDAHYLELTEGA